MWQLVCGFFIKWQCSFSEKVKILKLKVGWEWKAATTGISQGLICAEVVMSVP